MVYNNSMTLPPIDLAQATDEELKKLSDDIYNENQRRSVLVSAATQMDNIRLSYLSAEGVAEGEAWRQPEGAHNAYPKDWRVVHNGKNWVSLVGYNVWEPGIAQWREETVGNEWPDWVQPTGAQDAYPLDAQVTHNTKHWISEVDANVWEPGSEGAELLWTEQP